MSRLHYYTEAAVRSLRHQVPDRLEWYYFGANDAPQPVGVERATGETYVAAVEIGPLLDRGGHSTVQDPKNAIRVYDALRDLKPKDAADERFWVHLCHVECATYIRERWLRDGPMDGDGAARKVYNHFFASGNRALIRDNALSRLWWLGHIAHEVAPEDPPRFLQILMHRQDIRSALIERPSVSMNPEVLQAVYAVMLDHWQRDGRRSKLFERDVFRDWMIRLNRRGGVMLLDALPPDALSELLGDEAQKALRRSN